MTLRTLARTSSQPARTEAERSAWLRRRLSFGALTVSDLDSLVLPTTADRTSPWASVTIPASLDRENAPAVAGAWLEHLAAPTTSISPWMTWFWHDYFAVSAPVVAAFELFAEHIDLLQTVGMGTFETLLRSVTVDPAMLIFLDGHRSRTGAVNENFGRELLELYGLGIGNYDESDVRAAAVALTGWVVDRERGASRFIDARHDGTPQDLLGQRVDDVDSTIAAVVEHAACPSHVVGKLSVAILGRQLPTDLHVESATRFRQSGLDIAALALELIDRALDDQLDVPVVLSPIQWLLQTQAITGAELQADQRLALLRQMGQVPGVPPNVGGYPGGETWAAPSAMIGRFRAASVIAALTPDSSEALDAARNGQWNEVADMANRPAGLSVETLDALDTANQQRRDGREALAAVLMAPEMAVA